MGHPEDYGPTPYPEALTPPARPPAAAPTLSGPHTLTKLHAILSGYTTHPDTGTFQMAHELEFVNGTASMFAVGETAWHREGTTLVEAPSYREGMTIARLDYEVEKRTTGFSCTTPDGDSYTKSSKFGFSIVRTDTQTELGSVGADYKPVQNADAFRVLEPLIDTGVARLETGGVLRDGADAWLMVRWDLTRFGPIVREIFADEVVPFGLLAVNHSGRRGILLQDTNIRVVCANTLGFAEGSTERRIMVKHSGKGMEQLVEAARTMWDGIIERYTVLAQQYRALKATVVTEAEFSAAVEDVIALDPIHDPKFNPEAKLADVVRERRLAKRAEVRRLMYEGKGHDGTPTAWNAYNGAVELLDHNREMFPNRAGSWRTASLMAGPLRQMKDTVLENLIEVCRDHGNAPEALADREIFA